MINLAVNMFIYHWATMVTGENASPEEFGREVQKLDALLYADDKLLTSPHMARMQEALDILLELFNRVDM